MSSLVLYCKSYSTDLRRVARLMDSIERFNHTNIPVYLSVPEAELELFRNELNKPFIRLLTDESILSASPGIDINMVRHLNGAMSQQIVKSEFWRLGLADAYVCLDSDAVFIRQFSAADFLAPDGYPYTLIDEAQSLLEDAIRQGRDRIFKDFLREAASIQECFGRNGKRYSFGPFPLVWHRKVWESLETHYLRPRNITFADAIALIPIESRWYGEALLAYQAIPLRPTQALFKVYHYAWQFDKDQSDGITSDKLRSLYTGVIYQSAWERDMDWPAEGGSWLSKIGRRIRRKLGKI